LQTSAGQKKHGHGDFGNDKQASAAEGATMLEAAAAAFAQVS